MKRVHVRVHGRVQGVFFRDTVRREADRLAVKGWVRNCADGTVEGVFEGAAEHVDAVLECCRRGPGRAEVDRLDVHEEEVEGLAGFEVR